MKFRRVGRFERRSPRLVCALALLLSQIVANPKDGAATEPCLPSLPSGLSSLMPVPIDNPLTEAKIELGRKLFFDPALSRDGTISCASCHDPEQAFTDGRKVSIGIYGQAGRRNAPSLLNAAYLRTVFWDGRAGTLEAQVSAPLTNSVEMGNTSEAVIEHLGADEPYRALFAKAFDSEEISSDQLSKALAAFQRTLVAANSPFDRYARGEDEALSLSARRGLRLFRSKARCSRCHEGELFTDHRFHNTGVSWGKTPQDLGRYEHTGREEDKGKFKTPSLRNVALTPPYMHDGSFGTLDDVVEFYNQGGRPNPRLDRTIRPLQLSDTERDDLIAILKALTSETFP